MRLAYDSDFNVYLIPLFKKGSTVFVMAYSQHGSRIDTQIDTYDESQLESLDKKSIEISPLGQQDIIYVFFDMYDAVMKLWRK